MLKASRRRLPALVATTALAAALLPASLGTASAATAVARNTSTGCPQDRVPSAGFGDTKDKFGERDIDCVAWYGVASGSKGLYSPNGLVTRGAMAGFLTNLLKAADKLLDPSPADAFDDDNGVFFELQINQLAALGIFNGSVDSGDVDNDGDTTERVAIQGGSVTRAQMASFINETHAIITGVKISSADDFFTDDNGTFFEPSINAIASVGIGSGTSATKFSPNGTITRGAMALFLAREIDYLVELGFLTPPVNGNADILLDETSVAQGRQVTGRIVTRDGIGVTAATVDICSGTVATNVNMNPDNFVFSFNLPFSAPEGDCVLDFTVSLANNNTEQESQGITVLPTDKVLAGPELVSISVQTVGADTVTIRYEFNEDVNAAVEASKFRLYGFAGNQFSATQAVRVDTGLVEATFTRAQYDDATTGGLDRFAVQDLDGLNNAEFGFGLKAKALKAGETSFPDLLTVTGSATTLTFTLDAPAFNVTADDFGAVYSVNGVTSAATGTSIVNGADGATAFTVTFAQPEGGVAVRGFVKAKAFASAIDGTAGSARQAEDVAGASQSASPHLTSVILDPANNQVQLVFSEAVTSNAKAATTPPTCSPQADPTGQLPVCAPAIGLSLYDINGAEVRSTAVAQGSPNTLVATFTAGQVTGLVQGASIDQGFATAQRNASLKSGVDEIGRQNTFQEGRTAAPDLTNVIRTSDADGNIRIVYTFDQAPVINTANGSGEFVLYGADNSRVALAKADCTVAGVEVVCIVASDGANFAFAAQARYAAVSYSAVSTGGTTPKFNPEGGKVL